VCPALYWPTGEAGAADGAEALNRSKRAGCRAETRIPPGRGSSYAPAPASLIRARSRAAAVQDTVASDPPEPAGRPPEAAAARRCRSPTAGRSVPSPPGPKPLQNQRKQNPMVHGSPGLRAPFLPPSFPLAPRFSRPVPHRACVRPEFLSTAAN
jgi:hypothetical protein